MKQNIKFNHDEENAVIASGLTEGTLKVLSDKFIDKTVSGELTRFSEIVEFLDKFAEDEVMRRCIGFLAASFLYEKLHAKQSEMERFVTKIDKMIGELHEEEKNKLIEEAKKVLEDETASDDHREGAKIFLKRHAS